MPDHLATQIKLFEPVAETTYNYESRCPHLFKLGRSDMSADEFHGMIQDRFLAEEVHVAHMTGVAMGYNNSVDFVQRYLLFRQA